MPPRCVLVAGVPRSGTTWVGEVIGRLAGSRPLHEPDNEKEYVSALAAKHSLGRFPVLRAGDEAERYARLWEIALGGELPELASRRCRVLGHLWRGVAPDLREHLISSPLPSCLVAGGIARFRPQDRRSVAVVKSVHAVLALEWLGAQFPTVRVVIVLRHPAAVLNSWLELQLPDRDRALDRRADVRHAYLERWRVPMPVGDPLHRAAWHVCLLTAAVVEAAGNHPGWSVVDHDQLCNDALSGFSTLADELGLDWTNRAEAFLEDSNRPGTGFDRHRLTAEQPGRWKRSMDADAYRALARVARDFPYLDRWSEDLHSADLPDAP